MVQTKRKNGKQGNNGTRKVIKGGTWQTTKDTILTNIKEQIIANKEQIIANKEQIKKNEQFTKKNEQLTKKNEQLTAENEQLTAENEQLTKKNDQLTAVLVAFDQFKPNGNEKYLNNLGQMVKRTNIEGINELWDKLNSDLYMTRQRNPQIEMVETKLNVDEKYINEIKTFKEVIYVRQNLYKNKNDKLKIKLDERVKHLMLTDSTFKYIAPSLTEVLLPQSDALNSIISNPDLSAVDFISDANKIMPYLKNFTHIDNHIKKITDLKKLVGIINASGEVNSKDKEYILEITYNQIITIVQQTTDYENLTLIFNELYKINNEIINVKQEAIQTNIFTEIGENLIKSLDKNRKIELYIKLYNLLHGFNPGLFMTAIDELKEKIKNEIESTKINDSGTVTILLKTIDSINDHRFYAIVDKIIDNNINQINDDNIIKKLTINKRLPNIEIKQIQIKSAADKEAEVAEKARLAEVARLAAVAEKKKNQEEEAEKKKKKDQEEAEKKKKKDQEEVARLAEAEKRLAAEKEKEKRLEEENKKKEAARLEAIEDALQKSLAEIGPIIESADKAAQEEAKLQKSLQDSLTSIETIIKAADKAEKKRQEEEIRLLQEQEAGLQDSLKTIETIIKAADEASELTAIEAESTKLLTDTITAVSKGLDNALAGSLLTIGPIIEAADTATQEEAKLQTGLQESLKTIGTIIQSADEAQEQERLRLEQEEQLRLEQEEEEEKAAEAKRIKSLRPTHLKSLYPGLHRAMPYLGDIPLDTPGDHIVVQKNNTWQRIQILNEHKIQDENTHIIKDDKTIEDATSILPAGIFVGTDKYTEQLNYYTATYLALLDLKKKGKLTGDMIDKLSNTPDRELEIKIDKLTGKSRIKST